MQGKFTIASILSLLCLFVFTGCALSSGKRLNSKVIGETDIKGTYRVVLFGGRHLDDVETVALLDRDDDEYIIAPFAPDFDFIVLKELSAKKALEEAQIFVSFHHDYLRTVIREIFDTEGNTIGYEFRPLYMPLSFGLSDVMYVDYSLDGKTVNVFIRLNPNVEQQLYGGDGGDSRSGP